MDFTAIEIQKAVEELIMVVRFHSPLRRQFGV
jgi:hypothetical protein